MGKPSWVSCVWLCGRTHEGWQQGHLPSLTPQSHGDRRMWALVTGPVRNPPPVTCNLCNLEKKISPARSLQSSQNGYPIESWRVQGAVAPGGACAGASAQPWLLSLHPPHSGTLRVHRGTLHGLQCVLGTQCSAALPPS